MIRVRYKPGRPKFVSLQKAEIMRRLLLLLFIFSTFQVVAQEELLAKQYFEEGSFSKAILFYEKLSKSNPGRSDFAENLVKCYQQLEQYDKAISFLTDRINSRAAFPTTYIDLGYTYLLKDGELAALPWYEKALSFIEDHPNTGYAIGYTFQRYTLLDYALRAYRRSMELNLDLDFNLQIAQIFGEQGNIPEMLEAYLDVIARRPGVQGNVLRALEDFISDNPQDANNLAFKRILLTRAQRTPNPMWNEFLSWMLVRQGQFAPALIQEKAIYKRLPEIGLQRIAELGDLAEEAGQWDIADKAFGFVVSESPQSTARLRARLRQIHLMELPANPNLDAIQKGFTELLEAYPLSPEYLSLYLAYAEFLAYQLERSDEGVALLKQALELPLSDYASGLIKLKLGDLLVFSSKFNEGLIQYTQVQKRLKNDVMGQEARFKVARTSFYKGDFDWALTQLKVLRESASQLIANDAMSLSLIISDNSLQDSTQTALRAYARADLLAYQNKTEEAIKTLEIILANHKGEAIEDEALLRHAALLDAKGDFEGAELSYRKIITFFGQDILADDAHYALAELYKNQLNNPAAAMEQYQEIIYHFQDSYFFPDARKKYRALRGDSLN